METWNIRPNLSWITIVTGIKNFPHGFEPFYPLSVDSLKTDSDNEDIIIAVGVATVFVAVFQEPLDDDYSNDEDVNGGKDNSFVAQQKKTTSLFQHAML